MLDALRLIYAVLIILAAGRALFKLADRKYELPSGLASKYAVSFLLGMGAVSLQMFFYSLAGLPFGVFDISVPWIMLAGLILLFGRARIWEKMRSANCGFARPGRMEAVLAAFIASQAAYVFAYALVMPISGWDSWAIWYFKAKVFYGAGGVPAGFLLDKNYGYAHPDYPLLIPLCAAWLYTAMGKVSESAAKVIYPLQYASMLAVFYFAVKRRAGTLYSLVFTALLAMTPIVLVHAAGFPIKIGGLYSGDFAGYADLALSAYFLGAGAFIHFYIKEGRPPDAVLAALFLGMGAWTKNEGLAFAFAGGAVIVWRALAGDKGLGRAASIIAPIALFTVPWSAYKAYYGISSEYTGNISAEVIRQNFSRLRLVLSYYGDYMFLKTGLFSLTWWAYVLSGALNFRGLFRKEISALNALVMLQLCVYAFVYVITPADVKWQLSTSLERLLLHLTPLALFISAVNASMFLKRRS